MDKEIECDFYFGDKVDTPIKLMDVKDLNGYKKTVKNKKIIFNKFVWQKGVVKLVFRKYKFYIITGDTSILSNWVIALFALLFRKKVYLWMHGLKGEPSWKGKLLTYPLYYMADKYLLYGDFSKNIMLKKGFNQKKIICIYNSLNYDKQINIRSNLNATKIYDIHFKNDFPVLIYFGRIQHVKKIDMILDVMAMLKCQGVKCNLVIVGEDIEGVALEKIISKNKLQKNVWLYGGCYEEEKIGELIYNADVCVSPGNIGLAAMHSLVYGTPAITHDNFSNQGPEFEAIQPKLTGDFFKENNVDDLSEKIKTWICLDKQKREKVRQNCYAIIDEKYNPNFQIKILKELTNN